ncbi:MAG TPA: BamA/TamA family outer membrane protein [Terrimicrobiaceae bacterium]|nr:BamA/TamA family outer membrane protein [Terrimicrobiaceae bacterium]
MRRLAVAGVLACLAWPAAAQRTTQDFAFEGQTLFSRAQLINALRRYDISLQPPIEATTADDAAFFLREFLFGQGLPEADVTYELNPRTVVFRITEGPRFFLGKVECDGAEAISSQRMHDIFIAEMRARTLTPFGRLRFVEGAAESGGERIRQALVQMGFLDADVAVVPEFSDRTVDVAVTAVPGRQYVIRQVSVRGGGIPDAVRDLALAFQGTNYLPGQEIVLRSRMIDALRKAGFFAAEVDEDVDFRSDDGSVSLTVDVRPGSRFRMDRVTIQGNRKTLAAAIRKRLGLRPGSPYNASQVDEGTRRLWFSGAFSDVDVRQTGTPEHTVDLDLRLEEAAAKQVSATIGYGEWDRGFAEGTYTDRNFLGTLNRFTLRGFVSQKSHGVESRLSDPWFLETNIIASLGAFYVRQELPAFQTTAYGASLGLERRKNQTSLTGWRAAYEWKAVTDSTVYAGDSLDGAAINYTLGAISFRQTLDERNDLLTPMKGYFLQWEGGLASQYLLGDVSFLRLNVQATWYLPLRKITAENPFVPFVVLNHRAGLILPFGGEDDVPIQERYFLGGPDSVRSFQLDGMPPRDAEGDLEGGMAYFLGNAEIQFPVWRAFYLAAFVDVGNLSSSIQEMSWSETRIGPGLGARVYTPIGAIRVDYGYNVIRKDGDPVGAWQFGFGFTF